MILQGNQGQTGKQTGQNITAGVGEFSDILVTELMPRYYENIYRGKVFSVAANAVATPTGAVPLGAAGTPLVAIYNPSGSGVNLVVLQTAVAARNVGTTLGLGSFWFSGGPTAVITAAASAYLNLLTLQGTGSSAKPYANAALTGSSALLAIRPIGALGYSATQATAVAPNGWLEDTAGGIVVIPGNVVAVSCSVTGGTGSTVDAALIWTEIPA